MMFTCVSVRDRFRTMVNVMGDALATGIMAHICRKDFVKEGEEVGKSLKTLSEIITHCMWTLTSITL